MVSDINDNRQEKSLTAKVEIHYDDAMLTFQDIKKRAEKRKGGASTLKTILENSETQKVLKDSPSSHMLELMTKGIFQSGFVWRVIKQKWPDFLDVFEGFDIETILAFPEEKWDALAEEKRIVRNVTKIRTVRENAAFIKAVEQDTQKPFANTLADWPEDNLIGLWDYLKKNGSRLGGMTGQYFLRRAGKDSFILSRDVVISLQDLGLDIKDNPTSKRELTLIQDTFNSIKKETKLSYTNISRVLGYASGENYDAKTLIDETKKFQGEDKSQSN